MTGHAKRCTGLESQSLNATLNCCHAILDVTSSLGYHHLRLSAVSHVLVYDTLQAICAFLSVPACGAGQAEQGGAAGCHTGLSYKPAGEPCSCGDGCASCHLMPMGQVVLAM